MKDYIVFIQDLLIGRNEEFDNADKNASDLLDIRTIEKRN